MTPNPFAPPRAEVADPPRGQPPPPRTVQRACRLVVGSMLLGLVTLVPGIAAPTPEDAQVPLFITLALVMFFGGLTIWLAAAVGHGRRWARWALLAYLVLGWILNGMQFSDEFMGSPISGMIEIVCAVMELAASAMLFFGSGAKWFAELARLGDGGNPPA